MGGEKGVVFMPLVETIDLLDSLFASLANDLRKVRRGNKAAAQRVRVGTIELSRVGKVFRKESLSAEKTGKFKKKGRRKKKKR